MRTEWELSHCIRGDPEGGISVALFGDSHAASWEPALHALGLALGWRVDVLTHSGCPHYTTPSDSCAHWRKSALAHLAAHPPALILLSSFYKYDLEGGTQREMEASMRAIAGSPMLWLGDSPPVEDAPSCLEAHAASDARLCDLRPSSPQFEAFEALAKGAVDAVRGSGAAAAFFDVRAWMCGGPAGGATTCPAALGGIAVIRDPSGHLAASFVERLAPCLLQEIQRVPGWAAGRGGA